MGKTIEQIRIGKTSSVLRAIKLYVQIWTQFADHHPGPRLLEMSHQEA
jgi:hypothetical protein